MNKFGLLNVSVVFVLGVVLNVLIQEPEFPKLDSTWAGSTQIVATGSDSIPLLPYLASTIEQVNANFAPELLDTNYSLIVINPNQVYEPYTRGFIFIGGAFADQQQKRIVMRIDLIVNYQRVKPDNPNVYKSLGPTLTHEVTHISNLDQQDQYFKEFLTSIGWRQGLPSIFRYYILSGERTGQSEYGLSNPTEDLAATVDLGTFSINKLGDSRQKFYYKYFGYQGK